MPQDVKDPSTVSRLAMLAMAGALALTPLAGAKTLNGLGDSRMQLSSVYSPTSGAASAGTLTQKGGQSLLHHAEMQSKGKLIFDMSLGYAGPINGILKAIVVNGGSGYTNPSIAFNQSATGTVQTSNGVITGVTITNPGSGGSTFTWAITDATGSGAVVSLVNGGHGTFGTNGSTTSDMLARMPDVLANPPDILPVLGGYNDVLNGIPYATTTSNLKQIYELAMGAGIAVIAIPEPGETTLTTAQRQVIERQRKWVRAYVNARSFANAIGFRRIALADVTTLAIDMTSTAGTLLPSMSADGVHQSQLLAKLIGMAVWQAAQQFTGPAPLAAPRIASHADGFDSALNPGGYVTVYGASPVFVGTDQAATATVGSVNVTGTKPQDWLITRNAGSAGGTLACSIETPYADGRPGRRPVLDFSLGSGTATEQWQIATGSRPYTACGAIGGSGNGLLTAADLGSLFEVICEVELAGPVQNLTQLTAFFFASTPNIFHRCGADQGGTIHKVFNTAEQQPVTLVSMRTAPFPLHANVGNINFGLQIGFDASGAAGSALAKVKPNLIALRKVGVA